MVSSRGSGILGLALAVFMSLFGGSTLLAQEEIAAVEENAAEEEESTVWPRLTFHGFLTQAYAQSDGHQFLGIPKDGTADYRTAALQIRADISHDDAFVVQLSHERFGQSSIQTVKEDVELDWIFYEHRFGDTSVKVGRVQLPFGIYNEVRDVGTLLPFYRPSTNFYSDGAFGTETIDGIVLTHNFHFGSNWGLGADLHYGDGELVERGVQGHTIRSINDSEGIELWLDTPVSGLRFGAGGMRYDLERAVGFQQWEVYHVSAAADFERISAHAEYKETDVVSLKAPAGYVHVGVKVTDKLELNGQRDMLWIKRPGAAKQERDDDLALGVNYFLRPELVLKAEHHWNEGGFFLEDLPFFTAVGVDTRYWLVSLSTSF